MASFIIAMVLLFVLYVLVFGSLGMYLAMEKGNSGIYGWFIGMLLPLVGHIILAMKPTSNQKIVEDVYSRGLMTKTEYEKTQEIILKDMQSKTKK